MNPDRIGPIKDLSPLSDDLQKKLDENPELMANLQYPLLPHQAFGPVLRSNCTCACHHNPGMVHTVACCIPDPVIPVWSNTPVMGVYHPKNIIVAVGYPPRKTILKWRHCFKHSRVPVLRINAIPAMPPGEIHQMMAATGVTFMARVSPDGSQLKTIRYAHRRLKHRSRFSFI